MKYTPAAVCKGFGVLVKAQGGEGCSLVEHVAQHLVACPDKRQRPRRRNAQVVHGFTCYEFTHAAAHDRPAVCHAAVWCLASALNMLLEVCYSL